MRTAALSVAFLALLVADFYAFWGTAALLILAEPSNFQWWLEFLLVMVALGVSAWLTYRAIRALVRPFAD